MDVIKEVENKLFELQDEKYKNFQIKLIPNIDDHLMIGVRTPDLRSYAKTLIKENKHSSFLNKLPHKYFDENQLHAFIISELKNYDECLDQVNRFLPYVDNWATCDQLSPKIFKKNKTKLINEIMGWIKSKKTYTVRFGIGALMQHYLDDTFKKEYLDLVSSIRSNEYYINMMIAWYFSVALAKKYEYALPYIEKHTLDAWTHNKAIQKSLESRRITKKQKEYLKSLKVKRKS